MYLNATLQTRKEKIASEHCIKKETVVILGITPEGEVGLIMVLVGLLMVGAIAAWSMTPYGYR